MIGRAGFFTRLKFHSTQRRLRWLGWGISLAVFYLYVFPLRTHNPCDYYGFWIIGQSAPTAPVNNVYTYGAGVRICADAKANTPASTSYLERVFRRGITRLDSTGSPFLYSVFRLISTGDFKRDYDRYRKVCAVIYVLAILALATYLDIPWWSMPAIVYVFTLIYWPFRRDVMDANNSSALAGAVILALMLLRSPTNAARVSSGFVLGLLSAFKPTVVYAPLLVMLVLLITDRKSLMFFGAGFALAITAALTIPQFVVGPACTWKNWWATAQGRAYSMRSISGGVPGRFLRFGDRTSFKLFSYATLAAFSVGLWWIFRPQATTATERFQSRRSPPGYGLIAAGSLGLVCYLLSGPLVWGHYFALAMPTGIISMRPRPYRADRGWRAQAIGALGCLLIGPHHIFRSWGWTSWSLYSPFTIVGTLLITGVVFWDLWDYRRWRPAIAGNSAVSEGLS